MVKFYFAGAVQLAGAGIRNEAALELASRVLSLQHPPPAVHTELGNAMAKGQGMSPGMRCRAGPRGQILLGVRCCIVPFSSKLSPPSPSTASSPRPNLAAGQCEWKWGSRCHPAQPGSIPISQCLVPSFSASATAFHLSPAAGSSPCSSVHHCTSHPSPSHRPPWLCILLAPPALCFRGFYEPSCILMPFFLLQLITESCAT